MKQAPEFRELAGRDARQPPAPGARRKIALVRQAFVDPPGLDTAVSRAVLLRVAAGERGETLRLHVPGRVVAFGRRDVAAPGYRAAVEAAAAAGFQPVERLAGGRAAIFHEATLAFAWAVPDPEPPARTQARFAELAGTVAAALVALGIDARVGEVPGEYCPGEWSVNARGAVKLMGVGQRLARGAAHVGGVIVVGGAALVREALGPVYAALGLPWDPAAVGAVEDEAPGASLEAVAGALVAELARHHDLEPGPVDTATLALARRLQPEHVPTPVGPAAGRR